MGRPSKTADGFLLQAREFFQAAELLSAQSEAVSLPVYFLYGRSIELALKAYLLRTRSSIRDLRRLGHDLTALYDECVKQGMGGETLFDHREQGVLYLLNVDYLSKRFEYRISGGTYHLPLIDVTRRIAKN